MTAFYDHAVTFYSYLEEHSEMNEHEERIFVGFLRDAYRKTGASSRWYSSIRKILDSPDLDPCITLVQQGNVSQPSIVRLNHPPPEQWKNISEKGLTGSRESARLGAEFERRIDRLEGWRESLGEVNLSETLLDFERRLSRLERESRKRNESS